jgi:hypothetical protein
MPLPLQIVLCSFKGIQTSQKAKSLDGKAKEIFADLFNKVGASETAEFP